jgi:hypothetical protein
MIKHNLTNNIPNFTQPTNQTTTPSIQTLVAGNFTYTNVGLTQSYSQIITLNYNDSFRVIISKTNGGTIGETLGTGYITCQRLF